MARRDQLMATAGLEIVRFQDASNEVDDAAAQVLGLERADLPCISMLLFVGPASREQLRGALRLQPRECRAMLERLELAGYVRDSGALVELTQHARDWVQTLWGPLQQEGLRLLGEQSTRDLEVLVRMLEAIRPVHEAHAVRIRAMLEAPGASLRSNRLRGGLSPAALRRVQLVVAANLERSLRLAELATRAGLSTFHFARAFKISMGTTPRSYLEAQRVERAKGLLRDTQRPLAQIAGEVGLGTQSHFTTVFRRATGFTPAAWRRQGATT